MAAWPASPVVCITCTVATLVPVNLVCSSPCHYAFNPFQEHLLVQDTVYNVRWHIVAAVSACSAVGQSRFAFVAWQQVGSAATDRIPAVAVLAVHQCTLAVLGDVHQLVSSAVWCEVL